MIKILSTSGATFTLGPEKISQRYESGSIFRSVSRKQVAQVFRGTISMVDGIYPPPGAQKIKNNWYAAGGKTYFSIGCQHFKGKERDQIRKWAFARRKKKS